jgi:enamine deaminase RidA (YjgF/YER057c/UK114 family)
LEKSSKRHNYRSKSKWEDIVGYSRAVKIGNVIEVAGTTAVDEEGKVHGINDPYIQTKFILEKIKKYLHNAGSSLSDVIRTRIFVVNIDHWELVGKAHGEYFDNIKPVSTMVEVQRLIDSKLLVEIEVSAVLTD